MNHLRIYVDLNFENQYGKKELLTNTAPKWAFYELSGTVGIHELNLNWTPKNVNWTLNRFKIQFRFNSSSIHVKWTELWTWTAITDKSCWWRISNAVENMVGIIPRGILIRVGGKSPKFGGSPQIKKTMATYFLVEVIFRRSRPACVNVLFGSHGL